MNLHRIHRPRRRLHTPSCLRILRRCLCPLRILRRCPWTRLLDAYRQREGLVEFLEGSADEPGLPRRQLAPLRLGLEMRVHRVAAKKLGYHKGCHRRRVAIERAFHDVVAEIPTSFATLAFPIHLAAMLAMC